VERLPEELNLEGRAYFILICILSVMKQKFNQQPDWQVLETQAS
jgi:hypothetical protein